MILFFDTETNGLPTDYNASPYTPGAWPDLLQLAYIIQHDDCSTEEHNIYIRQPADFQFDAGALAVHGITQEQLDAGMDKEAALIAFLNAVDKADRIVAHNIDFDSNIIKANWHQLTMKQIEIPNQFCTMKSPDIQHHFGFKKWPKLQALYKKIIGKEFDNAHNAMNDVRALSEIYFLMVEQGII